MILCVEHFMGNTRFRELRTKEFILIYRCSTNEDWLALCMHLTHFTNDCSHLAFLILKNKVVVVNTLHRPMRRYRNNIKLVH